MDEVKKAKLGYVRSVGGEGAEVQPHARQVCFEKIFNDLRFVLASKNVSDTKSMASKI